MGGVYKEMGDMTVQEGERDEKTNKRSTEQSFYSHTERRVIAFQIINHVIRPLVHHLVITFIQGGCPSYQP